MAELPPTSPPAPPTNLPTAAVASSAAVPTPNRASPAELDWGDNVIWWKPGLFQTAKLMGWRWLLLLPAAALLIVLALIPTDPVIWQMMWIGGIKMLVMIFALPFILAGQAFSKAVKRRADPFCIHCGYSLAGLPDNHRCPECGREYSFAMIDEYRRDPQWFIQRWNVRHEVPRRQQPFAAGASKRKSRDGT